jgi:hypothetical protein
VLALLVLVLVPQAERYQEGRRAVRLAHLAMLDQQTALRAFLTTRPPEFLEPYERGSAALPGHNAEVRERFAGATGAARGVRQVEQRQQDWQRGWADQALQGFPDGPQRGGFLRLDKRCSTTTARRRPRPSGRADALRERAERSSWSCWRLGWCSSAAARAVGRVVVRQFRRLRATS